MHFKANQKIFLQSAVCLVQCQNGLKGNFVFMLFQTCLLSYLEDKR